MVSLSDPGLLSERLSPGGRADGELCIDEQVLFRWQAGPYGTWQGVEQFVWVPTVSTVKSRTLSSWMGHLSSAQDGLVDLPWTLLCPHPKSSCRLWALPRLALIPSWWPSHSTFWLPMPAHSCPRAFLGPYQVTLGHTLTTVFCLSLSLTSCALIYASVMPFAFYPSEIYVWIAPTFFVCLFISTARDLCILFCTSLLGYSTGSYLGACPFCQLEP